jgi:mono/diheme cytochrome c family protein
MTPLLIRMLLLAAVTAGGAFAQTRPEPAPSRGELLYSTHCIECHNTERHWRELKQVRDWDTLKAQVRRWQAIGKLGWSETDIIEVTRFLNQTIYDFPQPVVRLELD